MCVSRHINRWDNHDEGPIFGARLRNFITLVITVPKQDDQDDEGEHNDEQERDDDRHHDQAGLFGLRGGAICETMWWK